MADMNFMDVFFDSGLSIPSLTHESKVDKKDSDCLEWISDDFLDSILESSNPLVDQFFSGEPRAIDSFMECGSSDSGVSGESVTSPSSSIGSADDLCLNNALLETDDLIQETEGLVKLSVDENGSNDHTGMAQIVDTMDYIKEEEVECEEVFDTVYVIGNDSIVVDDVRDTISVAENDNDELCTATFSSDNSSGSDCNKVTDNICRKRYKRSKISNYSYIQRLRNKRKFSDISEGITSDDSDCIYPRLQLTPEEQNLAVKEGIKLPTHYPLTKTEERELKRIRRKIRNKISAQDSRRRRKEYVDGLEERVKQTEVENANLLKRIRSLENQRLNLVTQVKKIQAFLARSQSSNQPSSTCLMVLLMSLALVLTPSARNSFQPLETLEDEGISLAEDTSTPSNAGRLSTQLFGEKSSEILASLGEEANILEEIQKMQLPVEGNTLKNVVEILKLAKLDSSLKEHDYFRSRKRSVSEMEHSMTSWNSGKMVAELASQLKTIVGVFNRTNNRAKMLQRNAPSEPVVIDLSD